MPANGRISFGSGPLLNRTSAKPFVSKAVSVSLTPVPCLGAGKWLVHFCMGSIHN